MQVDVIALPALATPEQIRGKTIVVFDVLRATTTITAALEAGVGEIRTYPTIDEARAARAGKLSDALLCGEAQCLPPPGFDLGNSPAAFARSRHFGRTLLMCTTNGTRAILAAREARLILAGALTNASAVAQAAAESNLDITLLCAGTNGQIAAEDLIGAGAVLDALQRQSTPPTLGNDSAAIALDLFLRARHDLSAALSATRGGQNVLRAGLGEDIAFAARLDASTCVGKVCADTVLRIIQCSN